jgi:hypothetical protein
MESELKKEVGLQINYLGDSEYLLGNMRAETKDVASIVAEIQKHRAPFEAGRVVNSGSMMGATAENWKRIVAESEKAARTIMLQNSSALAELNELERKAQEAAKVAAQKKG